MEFYNYVANSRLLVLGLVYEKRPSQKDSAEVDLNGQNLKNEARSLSTYYWMSENKYLEIVIESWNQNAMTESLHGLNAVPTENFDIEIPA